MKREYQTIPQSMENMQTYGFSWREFITAIPSPLFVVTTYKSNGKPNACLQSWASFSGDENGFYATLSNVNKAKHLYQTVKETGEAVFNFPSADIYPRCMETVRNNGFDQDEITLSGLTAEPATTVNAPRIKECFLSLEGHFMWEHELKEGSSQVVMCFEIINICMDERYLDEVKQGRYGESGYLYNIHYPVNPEAFEGQSGDSIAVLQKLREMGRY